MAMRNESFPRIIIQAGRTARRRRTSEDVQRQTGNHISGGDQHEHFFRVNDNRPDQERDNDDGYRVQALADRETLKTWIADRAGHQGREREHQCKPSDRPAPIVQRVFPQMYGRRDHPCGSRARHAHEIFESARRHAVHVEARQPPRTADDKGEADQPGNREMMAHGADRLLREQAARPRKTPELPGRCRS